MPKLIINILLNVLIFGLLAVFIFFGIKLYKVYKNDNTAISQFILPRYLLSLIKIDLEEDWKTFDSQTFSFQYPGSWEPKRTDLFSNGVESVDLKVPVFYELAKFGGKTVLGYDKFTVEKRREIVTGLISEQKFVIANRNGYKWIYKQNNLYEYEYAIPLQTYTYNGKEVSSFVLHVEANNLDPKLEQKLDRIARSVKFKSDEKQ